MEEDTVTLIHYPSFRVETIQEDYPYCDDCVLLDSSCDLIGGVSLVCNVGIILLPILTRSQHDWTQMETKN